MRGAFAVTVVAAVTVVTVATVFAAVTVFATVATVATVAVCFVDIVLAYCYLLDTATLSLKFYFQSR